ncbi:hypothetical protein QU481_09475 [Crenobacter sp. SG2303]|uniref:SMODS and SLOG-associating 2TM effector domain-containing protein n=1 Tax=Crenobacter oryzisoli TaxID=3056844 RepID=A0ABT7XMW6_9NEIS|nr:hypothetical protein [Crenobacter sp. SG2303]MDN0075116.1 hypothetical protein [Crenobacter sp. SG2303]
MLGTGFAYQYRRVRAFMSTSAASLAAALIWVRRTMMDLDLNIVGILAGLFIGLMCLLLLSLAFRRSLIETWWFLTWKPFSHLVVEMAKWHAEHGVPFDSGEIDKLYARIRQAQDAEAECTTIRRELQLLK